MAPHPAPRPRTLRPGLRKTLRPLLAALLATSLLAGCDTAEERAAAHYARAKDLLAAGQTEQAIVEFRNVFQLDGNNKAARLDYANLMVERGETAEAIRPEISLSRRSPTRWPKVSLMVLKRSRSRKSTA